MQLFLAPAVAAGLLAGAAAAHAQPAPSALPAPTASVGAGAPLLSLGEVARVPGPQRATLRSSTPGGTPGPFDWTAVTIRTAAGTARGVGVHLAARDGRERSLVLDADEVEPLLAYLERAPSPPDPGAPTAELAFDYFQLRGGASVIGFPAVPGIRILLGGVVGHAAAGSDASGAVQIEGAADIERFRDALRAGRAAVRGRAAD